MESNEVINSAPALYRQMSMAPTNRSMKASLTLPLPVELRLQIFRHLLVGRNVRNEHGRHQFHTNVLRVNSAFYREAIEVLYKENIFVVIQHIGVDMFYAQAVVKVHAIARSHCSRDWSNAHCIYIRAHYGQPGIARFLKQPEKQELVIHADDLGCFINWLKLKCHESRKGPLPIIFSPTGRRPLDFVNMHEGSWPYQLHIRICLQPSAFGQLTEQQQRMVIAPFKEITGAQHVEIIGVDGLVDEMKKYMLPQVVSYQAIGWDLVKTVQSVKRDLDRLSSTSGTMQLACRGYRWLLASIRATSLSRSSLSRPQPHAGWPDALAVVACDIWNSWRVLQTRCQDPRHHQSGEEYISGWLDLLKERGTTKTVFLPKQVLRQRLLNAALFMFNGQCHRALASFDNAFRFAISVGLPLSQGALHDFGVLEAHCNADGSEQDHMLLQCDGPALTPTTSHLGFDSITMAELSTELFMEPPSNLVGWRDMDERYTKEDLEALGIEEWTDMPEILAK